MARSNGIANCPSPSKAASARYRRGGSKGRRRVARRGARLCIVPTSFSISMCRRDRCASSGRSERTRPLPFMEDRAMAMCTWRRATGGQPLQKLRQLLCSGGLGATEAEVTGWAIPPALTSSASAPSQHTRTRATRPPTPGVGFPSPPLPIPPRVDRLRVARGSCRGPSAISSPG